MGTQLHNIKLNLGALVWSDEWLKKGLSPRRHHENDSEWPRGARGTPKSISKGFAFEVCIWVICQKALKEVSNGFAFGVCNLGNLANERTNLAKIPSCGWLCKPNRASKVTREESAHACWPSIFIICQVQMPIPLEMTYFYLLHFVMEVCK